MTALTCRIMVIDDEPALLRLVNLYLTRLGYQVEAFLSGADAWRRYQSAAGTFDLVIADLTVPDFDMETVLSDFPRLNPDISVLVCSGRGFELDALPRDVRKHFGFLAKPFVPKMLGEAVAAMLVESVRHSAVA